MELSQMTSSEKDSFLSQEAKHPEFTGQTIGQILYAEIVKSVKQDYTPNEEKNLEENFTEYKELLNKRITEVVGEEYAETYLAELQRLREQRQRDIMQNVEHLYHFSQVPPEQFNELVPHIQQTGNALQEHIGDALCYADTKSETAYPLKPSTNEAAEYKGVSVYMDEQCLLVSGIDFEKYVRSLSPSYRYEVNKATFMPVVDLDGHFCNEYESTDRATVEKCDGPFDIETVYGEWNIPVFYIPDDANKDKLRNEYSKKMEEGMSRREAMTAVCHQYPEEMKLLQEDTKLQQIIKEVKQDKQDKKNKEEFDKSKKLMTEHPIMTANCLKSMCSFYIDTKDEKLKTEMLKSLYEIRKGGEKNKGKLDIAKVFKNVLEKNPEFKKDERLAALSGIGTISPTPTDIVKKQITR